MGTFWNTLTKDPKRNFRFKIIFAGLGDDTIWFAKKVSKPNFTVAESKHAYLNHTYYWPGRVEWQTVTMTLVDPVDLKQAGAKDGTVNTLKGLMEKIGYKPPAESSHLKSQSKARSAFNLGNVQIVQVDSNGTSVEAWTLVNPFIKKISYGELDYENDELTQIELELRYDWATQGDLVTDTTPSFAAGDPTVVNPS